MAEQDVFAFLEDAHKVKVTPKPWMTSGEFKFELVTTNTLPYIIDLCIASKQYSLDLETTGLDNRVYDGETVCKIVGICLSPDGKAGYYIPIRHKGEGEKHNISYTLVKSEMLRLINSNSIAIFHNGKFDQEFLQFCGGEPMGEWDQPKKWEDSMILAYLWDSRMKRKGLKLLSGEYLQMEMIELEELFPEDQRKIGRLDFSTLDPSQEYVIWYACSDAICTFRLKDRFYPEVMDRGDGTTSQSGIYNIEKGCIAAIRWIERTRVLMDHEKTKDLIRLGQKEWFDSLEEVYKTASEILGRDLRPGYYRLMRGDVDTQPPAYPTCKFDPNEVSPKYMDQVNRARGASAKNYLDPLGPNDKIQTVTKQVLKLAKPPEKGPHKNEERQKPSKEMEPVEFPVVYDVLVAEKLGLLLRELQVPGLVATEKSGQVATSAEELDRVLEEVGDKFPFAAKVKRFRETAKALGTYLLPILEDSDKYHTLKPNFESLSADTGRFTAPASKHPEIDGGTSFPFHGTPSTYDPKRPECLGRIRECIIPRPGKFIVALDFAGEELRIVTNLSCEPLWLNEFFRCSSCSLVFDRGDGKTTPKAPPHFCPKCGSDKIGDLHTLTALNVYGPDSIKQPNWKDLRQNGKTCNFALAYGGSGHAVCAATGCHREEGYRIKDQFDKTYTGLRTWWDTMVAFAKRYKCIVTSFGRRYPLPDIDHELGGFRAKAERNAVNGPVQALGADMIKLAMFLVYKECKARSWLEKVHMLLTMHDELVFEIDYDIIEEAIDTFIPIMTSNQAIIRQNWPVPFTSDVELGKDYTVKWDLQKIAKSGEWPEELKGLFPKRQAQTAKPREDVQGSKSTETKDEKTYKVEKWGPGEMERMAAYIAEKGLPEKVLGPDGEDFTVFLKRAWET